MSYSSKNPLSEKVKCAAGSFPTETVKFLSQIPFRRKGILKRRFKANRAVNVEAGLVQCCGVRREVSCRSCQKGNGPFVGCITISGQLDGSCANCHYHGLGFRCNFRKGTDMLRRFKYQTLTLWADQRDKQINSGFHQEVYVAIPSSDKANEENSFFFRIGDLHSQLAEQCFSWAKRFV